LTRWRRQTGSLVCIMLYNCRKMIMQKNQDVTKVRADRHQLTRQWDGRRQKWWRRRQLWWSWWRWRHCVVSCSSGLISHIIIRLCCNFLILHVHVLFTYEYSYEIVSFYSYIVHSHISLVTLLLLHPHVGTNKLAMPRPTSRDMNPGRDMEKIETPKIHSR
jgi:hypothetical protein